MPRPVAAPEPLDYGSSPLAHDRARTARRRADHDPPPHPTSASRAPTWERDVPVGRYVNFPPVVVTAAPLDRTLEIEYLGANGLGHVAQHGPAFLAQPLADWGIELLLELVEQPDCRLQLLHHHALERVLFLIAALLVEAPRRPSHGACRAAQHLSEEFLQGFGVDLRRHGCIKSADATFDAVEGVNLGNVRKARGTRERGGSSAADERDVPTA